MKGMKGFDDRCLDVNVDVFYVKLRGASISPTLDHRVVFTMQGRVSWHVFF